MHHALAKRSWQRRARPAWRQVTPGAASHGLWPSRMELAHGQGLARREAMLRTPFACIGIDHNRTGRRGPNGRISPLAFRSRQVAKRSVRLAWVRSQQGWSGCENRYQYGWQFTADQINYLSRWRERAPAPPRASGARCVTASPHPDGTPVVRVRLR